MFPLGERVAKIEAQMERLEALETKLDQLLELKHRGAGAFWLFSLIAGSGILGLIITLMNVFRSH